jgi:hypothetical protein
LALSPNVVNAIYREQPTANATIDSYTVTYGFDHTLTLGSLKPDGTSALSTSRTAVNGDDSVTGLGVTIEGATYSTAGKLIYRLTPYTLTDGLAKLGYATNQTGGSLLTVQKKSVDLAGFVVDNKVYDGNTTATPTLAITAGLVGAEQINVSGSASFNSKNVLTANLVTVDSVTLSDGANGELASNYSLTAGQTATAFITPAPLTATVSAPNKVYDGNTTATPTLAITAGLVGAEQINVSGSASFNSKNVLTANLVTVQSVTLADGTSGDLASNYSLSVGQTTVAQITPASVTVSDIASASAVTGSFRPGAAVLVGIIGNDSVAGSVSLESPSYSAPGYLQVGDYKQTVNALSGSDASNYMVTGFTTTLANYTVTPLPPKSSASQQAVAVAALTRLPVNSVAQQRRNDISTPSSSTPSSSTQPSNSNSASSKPAANQQPDSPVLSTQTASAPPMRDASQADSALQTAGTRKPEVVLASLKQRTGRNAPTVRSPEATVASPLVAGFTEQDIDFAPSWNAMPTTPNVFAPPPTSLNADPSTSDSAQLDWEAQMYAGIREVLQSPVTYHVLTGASSVVFLVKTLLPSLLPTFQVPGSLPNSPPVRVPTAPGSMASGRTTWGRWLGRV